MRYKKSILAVALASVWFTLPASAEQEQEQEKLEVIQVTGSRIMRTSAQMTTPTTVVDSAMIQMSGAKNIGDLIHQLPALTGGFGGVSSNDNNGGNLGQAGLELANLRGLGQARTLVLVNSRRHVPGAAGQSAVDLSMIPTSLVDRVEIISGGASAIYGADAVTGVVNFIMKKDFEGLEVEASYGSSAYKDAKNRNLSVTWGTNFADNKANVTTHVAYHKRDELLMKARTEANNRPGFLNNPANTGPNDGISDTVFARDQRFQALSAEGLIYVPNENWVGSPSNIANFPGPPRFADDPFGLGYDTFTIDRDTGAFRDFISGVNCSVVPCDGGDGFRTAETNTLQAPSERLLFTARGQYEYSNNLELFSEFKYGRVESSAGGQASVFHDSNFGPLIALKIDNPFLPAELKTLMQERGVEASALAVIGLPSRSNNTRETMQLTFGGQGNWADYNYDFYLQHGRVDSVLLSQDSYNPRYYEALDATTDASGNAVCRSGNSACVAYNPIFFSASDEARAYAGVTLRTDQQIRQSIAAFSVNGDLFDWEAGLASFAAGVEIRHESSANNPDILSQARDADGVGSGLVGSRTGPRRDQNTYLNPVIGRYNVKELFAEVMIPLIDGMAFVDVLDLELAARVANHSITGTDFTYKAALNWGIVEDVRARATYSHAVRAPNIAELFAPSSIGGQRITDPCHFQNLNSGPNPTNRQANCAALGISNDFVSEASFGTRSVATEGNLELKPETATTYTLGLVWVPTADLNIALDYWNIDIEDAITSFAPTDVLSNCVDGQSLNAAFCDLVTRRSDGNINLVSVQNINASKFLARGTDLDVSYRIPMHSGVFHISMLATYLDKRQFWQNPADSSAVMNDAGSYTYPRLRTILNAAYRGDLYTLGWRINYVGESTFNKTNRTNPEAYPISFNNKVPAYIQHSLFAMYQLSDDVELYVNADNVTNEKPAFLPGINQGTILYDAIGSRFTVGVKATF